MIDNKLLIIQNSTETRSCWRLRQGQRDIVKHNLEVSEEKGEMLIRPGQAEGRKNDYG